MRTLGDRIGAPVDLQAGARVELEVLGRFEAIEIRQHARDRVEERVFVEMGAIDLGGEA